jgi:hypothetical protein
MFAVDKFYEGGEEKAVIDKIEGVRPNYDQDQSLSLPRLMQEEARGDNNCISHSDAIVGLFADDSDGILAMLKQIRDMIMQALLLEDEPTPIDPPASNRSATVVDEDDFLPKDDAESSPPDLHLEIAEKFMSVWHHVEVETAAKWRSISEDDASMVAMFREIGVATKQELASGRKRLSAVILQSMDQAITLAHQLRKDVSLLTEEGEEEEEKKVLPDALREAPKEEVKGEEDISILAMLSPSAWT